MAVCEIQTLRTSGGGVQKQSSQTATPSPAYKLIPLQPLLKGLNNANHRRMD